MATRPTERPHECFTCGQPHKQCLAHNKLGGPCGRIPADGADVCPNHGGHAPQVRAAAERRVQEAAIRREVDRLGIAVETDPTEALLRELWETVGNVEFLRSLVQQLPVHPAPDSIEWEDGKPQYKHGEPGIYGRSYHVSGIPTGDAKPHVLVAMYNDERKHLVDVAATAVRLGIEERRVNLEENRAVEVFRAVTVALTGMGLQDRFLEFRELFGNALANRPVPASIGAAS